MNTKNTAIKNVPDSDEKNRNSYNKLTTENTNITSTGTQELSSYDDEDVLESNKLNTFRNNRSVPLKVLIESGEDSKLCAEVEINDEISSNYSFLNTSSSPFTSLDSFTTSLDEEYSSFNGQNSFKRFSRMGSESGMSGRTFLVQLELEDQIERDSATEEQLARVRKEIEEMELEARVTASANFDELRRRKSRKDLIKVSVESGLPVALHPQETGKEDEGEGGKDEITENTLTSGSDSEETNKHKTDNKDNQFGGMRIVDEDHRNYILMYDMLTGIRTSVSRCQAKPSRPLTSRDFQSAHKMAFDLTGNGETPSSRYDFKFKDYAPWVFRSLREQFSIDAADYLVSLTGKYVLSELYSPGKSGSLFYYSQDYRFIIKTIRESEHLFLRKILPHYHRHIQDQKNSLLVRFYGLHRVQLPMGKKIYFVVMGNIFPTTTNRVLRTIYDLKGSTHGRWNPEAENNNGNNSNNNVNRKGPGPLVLKDLNWLNKREKLMLGPIKATQLMNQLKIDCKFLAKLKIMDYSLLVGLHNLSDKEQASGDLSKSKNSEFIFYRDFEGFQSSFQDNSRGPEVYYLGIIDILTPYSMSKRIEHSFKSLIFSKEAISAVNPTDYARRYLKFMSNNILQNVESDYNRRSLPLPPDVEELEGYGDDDDIVNINNLE